MSKIFVNRRYATVPNDILNNPSLSLKAKGLFGYIQSKPDGWKFSIKRMRSQLKEGTEALKAALKELESFGLLERIPKRSEKGAFVCYDYRLQEPQANPPAENHPSGKHGGLSKIEYSKKEIDSCGGGISLSDPTTPDPMDDSNEPTTIEPNTGGRDSNSVGGSPEPTAGTVDSHDENREEARAAGGKLKFEGEYTPEAYIEFLLDERQPYWLFIIGKYLSFKEFFPPTKEAMQWNISRDSKLAKILAKTPIEDLAPVFEYVGGFPDWTLETVIKYLGNPIVYQKKNNN